MEYLFAPMEGITFAQYRSVHHRLFPGVSEYYTPFIAPDSRGSFRAKYLKELTTDNEEYRVVPQLLVNNADSFTLTAEKLIDLGFPVINLNVGCPSGTVFSKHKGAGMLQDPEQLDSILEKMFLHAERTGYRISIKTRMGNHSTEEFPTLLEIYQKYPIAKLIVHARCRDDYYRGKVDLASFSEAVTHCSCPVTYNGDMFSKEDLGRLTAKAPSVHSVMIGRGAVSNPALFRYLSGGNQLELWELKRYHDELVDVWLTNGLSPSFTVERMKTLWIYMQAMFPQNAKQCREILKAKHLTDYQCAVERLLEKGVFEPERIKLQASERYED